MQEETQTLASAQSLICGKPDENNNGEHVERVNSEESKESEGENDDTDAEISSLASQIQGDIVIEAQGETSESDGNTIPVLDEIDVQERQLVE